MVGSCAAVGSTKEAHEVLPQVWRPRSVVIIDGIPDLDIQPLINACATASAVIVVRGRASGKRVNLSTQVRR